MTRKISKDYVYNAKCINVVDGDTFDIEFDLGFGIKYETRVRLCGVNAYETSLRGSTTEEEKKKGLEAKAFVEDLILGREIIVETVKDKKGKYGRYLATINFEDRDLGIILINKGFADFT